VGARRYVTELRPGAFAITLMEGRSSVARIGVAVADQDRVMRVRRVDVVPGARRHGVATALYERAAKLACSRFGLPLSSDIDRSPRSEAFWQKQMTKGRARRVPSNEHKGTLYVLSCPAPRSLSGSKRQGS
jgi:GNAT superfamily N-acetyltransferase